MAGALHHPTPNPDPDPDRNPNMAGALHHPNPSPNPDRNLIWQMLFIILTLTPTLTLPLIWQ
eukprot:3748925-Prymnesium_polylepis.1